MHPVTEPSCDTAPQPASAPQVQSVRRDRCHREIRLELADYRTRSGGVYDLTRDEQKRLLLSAQPPYSTFLPTFVIVYGSGDPSADPDGPTTWDDLHVHVGGLQWSYLTDVDTHAGRVPPPSASAAEKWRDLDALLNGGPRQDPAPAWLLDLISTQTPWAALVSPRA